MNAWIVRHDEALYEARRTLGEAIEEYGQGYSSRRSSLIKFSAGKVPSIHGNSSRHSGRAQDRQPDREPFDANGRMKDDDEEEDALYEGDEAAWTWEDHQWWAMMAGGTTGAGAPKTRGM